MSVYTFFAGMVNGLTGGLMGLSGVSLRVPGLSLPRTQNASLFRTLTGVVVVVAAWMCRAKVIPLDDLAIHLDVVLSLLAGSLFGAWCLSEKKRDWRSILAGLILVMLAQLWDGATGVLAGVAIGVVMGCDVAAGLLLVPAIVLLYDLDIKVAGSLALMVSTPMLVLSLLRGPYAGILAILRTERNQFFALAYGSVIGAAFGAVLLGQLPSRIMMPMLEAMLVYAAFINFGAFVTKVCT